MRIWNKGLRDGSGTHLVSTHNSLLVRDPGIHDGNKKKLNCSLFHIKSKWVWDCDNDTIQLKAPGRTRANLVNNQ